LAKSAGSIDSEKVAAYLVHHESGLNVLLAPSRPDQAAAVTVEFLRELYGALRTAHDFVIVDTPPGFTPEVIATIDSSTDLVVVGMLDSLSLKNTKLGLETLELMGYNPARIRVVLNRADSRVGITADDVDAILGRQPDVLVPSDRDVPRALNEAVPIVNAKRGSGVAKAFVQLAEVYSERKKAADNGNGKREVPGPKARRGFLAKES
jgi:pilus assembly protein CpaE